MSGSLTKQFPAVWDNTMRVTFASCPTQFAYRHVYGRTGSSTNVHLHAGKCFARGVEVMRTAFYSQGMTGDDALAAGAMALIESWGDYEPPDGAAKTLERMVGALEFYTSVWPLETDHVKPLFADESGTSVEFNFILPLPIRHPDSGEPILYSGRFDMLGQMNGTPVGVDEKTTSQLGNQWLNKWKLNSQFTGYMWGAREFGHSLASFFVRGVSILKNNYGSAEAIVHRSGAQLDLWHAQLLRDIERAKQQYVAGEFDQALNDTCSAYGGCQFMDVCLAADPLSWLESNYVEHRWDPTNVDDV